MESPAADLSFVLAPEKRPFSYNRWCVLQDGQVPEAGWTPIPRAGDAFDDSAMFDHCFEHPGDTVVQAFGHAIEGPIFHAHRGALFSVPCCRTLEQALASPSRRWRR